MVHAGRTIGRAACVILQKVGEITSQVRVMKRCRTVQCKLTVAAWGRRVVDQDEKPDNHSTT